MYQLNEALGNNIGHDYLLEERIAGLIHTSLHLAALFSELQTAMQNRSADGHLLCIEMD